MLSRIPLAVLLSVMFMSFSDLAGADATKPKATQQFKEEEVFQLVDYKEHDSIFLTNPKGGKTVNEHNITITAKSVYGGETRNVVVIEPAGGRVLGILSKMTPSTAYFTMEMEPRAGQTMARKLEPYKLAPGEERPDVFVFLGTSSQKVDGEDATVLKLYKLGKSAKAKVPGGKKAVDPTLAKAIDKLVKGDTVEVTTDGSGTVPTVRSIKPYAAHEEAVFSKITDAEVTGGRTKAIVVTLNGSKTTLLLPGNPDGKGTFVVDAALAEAIKKFQDGDKVTVGIRKDDDGRLWLRDIVKSGDTTSKT